MRPSGLLRIFQVAHPIEEALDRLQAIQGLDHAVEVEHDVLVNEDVAESRKAIEFLDEIGGESRIVGQVANRLGVVLEALPPK